MSIRSILLTLACATLAVPAGAQNISDYTSFMNAFSEAVRSDNFVKQQDLVSRFPDHARNGFFNWEGSWCEDLAKGEAGAKAAENLGKVLEALSVVYATVPPRSSFLGTRLKWLKDLKPEQHAAKAQYQAAISQLYPAYEGARKSRSEDVVRGLLPKYLEVAKLAESATDWYWAAQGYWYLGQLYELIPEWFPAVFYYKKAVEVGKQGHSAEEVARQRIDVGMKQANNAGKFRLDLIDVAMTVEEAKAKYDEALAAGAPPPADDGGAGGAAGGAPGGAITMAPPGPKPNVHSGKVEWEEAKDLKVAALTTEPTYTTPGYSLNSHWSRWPGVQIDKGQVAPAQMMPGGAELENDGGKIFLYPDGKKNSKTPVRLKLGAKPEVMAFDDVKYLDGTKGKVWHTLMQHPSTYSFNGFQFRTSGTQVAIHIKGASVAKGKVRGQDLVVHDVNGNGAFNDFGVDCIVSGTGKTLKVQPLSKYITIDGLLYELKIDANGRTVRTKPYDGPVTPLKADWAGNMKPEHLIAIGSGDDATYFLDLVEAIDHPIWVVPGTFSLYEGYFITGRGDKAQTMLISAGQRRTINIEPAKDNTWKLGGSGEKGFQFVFKAETVKEGSKEIIRLPAKEVKMVGSFGEFYEFPMFGVPTPTVTVRKGKDGPVVATEKMKKPESADLDVSTDMMWFPKTLDITKTFGGEYSVKMEGEYKPLGKITSEWISGS